MKLYKVNVWTEYREHTGLDVKIKVATTSDEAIKKVADELLEAYGYDIENYDIDVEEIDVVDGYEIILQQIKEGE